MFRDFLLKIQTKKKPVLESDVWANPSLEHFFDREEADNYDQSNPVHVQNWVRQTLASQLELLNTPQHCAKCSATFRELENIGQWGCRIHPGLYTPSGFTCCGRVSPCLPCDHRTANSEDWNHSTELLAVPTALLSLFKVPQQRQLASYPNEADPARSYVFVLRSDSPYDRTYTIQPLK